MRSHAAAVLTHIDPSDHGSLTVQSSAIQMFTTHEPFVDLLNPGGILFQSIHLRICEETFSNKNWKDLLR